MKQGQILILVLLVVVVALAIGLSVASRNITNLRTSTQTKESQRAFSAAEGGVEDALSRLSDLSGHAAVRSPTGENLVVTVGDLQANVNVKGSSVYESKVELGDVAQIDLAGFTGTEVQIDWVKGSGENSGDGPASVEVTRVNGPAPYTQTRWYSQGKARAEETLDASQLLVANSSCAASSGYEKCIKITITANPVILRIRPLWASATVKVAAVGAVALPIQTYDVNSTSSTSVGVSRAVQVKRTALPQMPAVFDFALFSESSLLK